MRNFCDEFGRVTKRHLTLDVHGSCPGNDDELSGSELKKVELSEANCTSVWCFVHTERLLIASSLTNGYH